MQLLWTGKRAKKLATPKRGVKTEQTKLQLISTHKPVGLQFSSAFPDTQQHRHRNLLLIPVVLQHDIIINAKHIYIHCKCNILYTI